MKIIFLGAPGAGKGTQADIVSERFGIPTISTGAIIRQAIQAGTEMGMEAKKFIENGALVPDDVVIGIIKERLKESDTENGFILDGFPRTTPQAEALDAMGIHLDAVVSIEVDDEVITSRMSGRRVCPKCSATYHIEFQPTADGIHCDKCGTELTQRSDDIPEVVRDRLKVYHQSADSLKEFYAARGILKLVYGCEKVDDTTKATLQVLGVE